MEREVRCCGASIADTLGRQRFESIFNWLFIIEGLMTTVNSLMHATLIGGKGFIGRHLHQQLIGLGWSCCVPERADKDFTNGDLGHVFYCAGLTADFRQRPYETVEAHVHFLTYVLQNCRFTSLTYLSSTRVYAGAAATNEDAALTVRSHLPGDLYNLSKLMGESLCLNSGRSVRIVRLSNVYGIEMSSQNFLSEILMTATKEKKVQFLSAPDSQKDYICIRDVVHYLPLIAGLEKNEIYNLAQGKNVSNWTLAEFLQNRGVQCSFAGNAPRISFPVIDTTRLRSNFGVFSSDLENDLPALFTHYSEKI